MNRRGKATGRGLRGGSNIRGGRSEIRKEGRYLSGGIPLSRGGRDMSGGGRRKIREKEDIGTV